MPLIRQFVLNLAIGEDAIEAIKSSVSEESEGGRGLTVRESLVIAIEVLSHLQQITGSKLAVIDLSTVPSKEELKQLFDENNIEYTE